MRENTLYIVIPCYNEQEVLSETAKQVFIKMSALMDSDKISRDSKVMFVDDGSKDKTWQIIEELCDYKDIFTGVKLSRNKGHQNALMAGLTTASEKADMLISMDADMQDDINAIDEFIEKYQSGCDVVYGVRDNRETDSFFKRFTAESFYKIMKVLGVDVTFNHADYRLMSKLAVQKLMEFEEVNLFLRGMVPLIGYKSDKVFYKRGERLAGESKYPLKKMISFAIDGITSFSIKPLTMIANLGIIIFFISVLILIYSLIVNIIGNTQPGWTTLMASIWMIGGIQIFCMGVIGQYVGKIYFETKRRPGFFIEKII